jgi:2-polyprenyl-3-methyl-5-hydroxy-6-metoxy-1,4-benzoquinol methylase
MSSLTNQSKAIQQSLGLSSNEIYLTGHDLLIKLQSRGAILDFGAGQGRFLQILSHLNFEKISGADLMVKPTDISFSCDWMQADLNKKLPCEDQLFDVIVAIEVIEHLENPRAVVKEWKRLLRPNGLLIFSTPNNESIRSLLALIMRGHFVSFLDKDYPAHITALTHMDMQRLLSENEFASADFHYTKNGLVPGLKGLTWRQLSFGLLEGKRFSDNVFVVTRKI